MPSTTPQWSTTFSEECGHRKYEVSTLHPAQVTMALLQEKFPCKRRIISRNSDARRPPRSCDFTPLDIFLWSFLKSNVYVNRQATIQLLKDKISRRVNEIEEQLCRDALTHFTARIDMCHWSRGGNLADIFLRN